MYSKYDKVVQDRLEYVAEIEFRSEQSREYSEVIQKQGLAKDALLALVPEEFQKQARELYELLQTFEAEKYNIHMVDVMCSVEFMKFFD